MTPRYIDANQIVYWIRHISKDGLKDDIRKVAFKDAIWLTDTEVVNFLNDLGYARERAVDGGILIKWERIKDVFYNRFSEV